MAEKKAPDVERAETDSKDLRAEVAGLKAAQSGSDRKVMELQAQLKEAEAERETLQGKLAAADALMAKAGELALKDAAVSRAIEGNVSPKLANTLADMIMQMAGEIRSASDAEVNHRLATESTAPRAGDTPRVLDKDALNRMSPQELKRVPQSVLNRILEEMK